MSRLRISTERWILESMSQGVYVLDKRGQLIYVNQYCEKLFGWEACSVLGRKGLAVLVADNDITVGTSILDYVTKGKVWSGLFRMKRVTGELMQTFMTASPILDMSGTVIAICATVVELEHLQPSSVGVSSFASVREAKWPNSPSTGDYPGLWQLLKSLWNRRALEAVPAPASLSVDQQVTGRGLGDFKQEQANSLQEIADSPQQQKGRLDWEAHKRRVKFTLADLKLPRGHFENNPSPQSESGSGSGPGSAD